MSVGVNGNSAGRAHSRRRLRYGAWPRGHCRCGARRGPRRGPVRAPSIEGALTAVSDQQARHTAAGGADLVHRRDVDRQDRHPDRAGRQSRNAEHARSPERDRPAGEQRDRRQRPAARVPGEFGHGPADHGEVEERLRLRRLVDSSRTSCLDLRIRLQTLECSTGCVSCGGGPYWRRVCVRHHLGAS
jgi:hypothetical protein